MGPDAMTVYVLGTYYFPHLQRRKAEIEVNTASERQRQGYMADRNRGKLVSPYVMRGRPGWCSGEELMLLNCGVGEDSWKSFRQQWDPTSPFWRRSVLDVQWKDWCWSWNSNTLATSCEELIIRKDSDAGRDWGQEEKGTTEDEMAGWYHWLDGSESGWTPGVGDVQGGLACCDSWGRKESDTTEWLNWTGLKCSFKNIVYNVNILVE